MRVEHTHCFSDHGEGGHYHEDTEPEVVEYEGYFSVAEQIYRFDPPGETHNIGRDWILLLASVQLNFTFYVPKENNFIWFLNNDYFWNFLFL